MSFGAYARRVRDTSRPYGARYSALRCAVGEYCPIGFGETWSWLCTVGDLSRDEAALVAALERLERSREARLAEMAAFADRRRAAKAEHRRFPRPEEFRFFYGRRWPGPDSHAAAVHTIESAWIAHLGVPFPPVPAADKGDLVYLDATVAGHISSYLGSGGRLRPEAAEGLLRCLPDLQDSVRSLTRNSCHVAAAYFGRLLKMAEMVATDVLPTDAEAAR